MDHPEMKDLLRDSSPAAVLMGSALGLKLQVSFSFTTRTTDGGFFVVIPTSGL